MEPTMLWSTAPATSRTGHHRSRLINKWSWWGDTIMIMMMWYIGDYDKVRQWLRNTDWQCDTQGIQMDRNPEDEIHSSSSCCLVAIGRLQVSYLTFPLTNCRIFWPITRLRWQAPPTPTTWTTARTTTSLSRAIPWTESSPSSTIGSSTSWDTPLRSC